jgi:hypothetical protein
MSELQNTRYFFDVTPHVKVHVAMATIVKLDGTHITRLSTRINQTNASSGTLRLVSELFYMHWITLTLSSSPPFWPAVLYIAN